MLNGTLRCLLLAALVAAATPTLAGAGEFELTIQRGRVTLVAQNAPLQDILAEWARIGQTTIVNGERLAGSPLTLQLIDVPEEQALETLLRSASGYVVAPRATPIPGASRFDRIFILASSGRPSTRAVRAPTPSVLQPAQGQPDEDELFGAPAFGEGRIPRRSSTQARISWSSCSNSSCSPERRRKSHPRHRRALSTNRSFRPPLTLGLWDRPGPGRWRPRTQTLRILGDRRGNNEILRARARGAGEIASEAPPQGRCTDTA